MQFSLTLLGTNGAIPAYGRFPTAQVLHVHNQSYLVDCGEGTQMRFQDFHIKPGRLHKIFISHLHGDHCFGLIGLITTLNLTGRTQDLHIYSPPGLRAMIEAQLSPSGTVLQFPLQFHEVDPQVHQQIASDQQVDVFSIPLNHRIPCCGYLFREKERERNIYSEKIAEYQLSVPQIKAAKQGGSITLDDGRILSAQELTAAPPSPRSYAFCSDTQYKPDIVPLIQGVDLLYHESTFCREYAERARETMHCTAHEAALIAREAQVGKLILGHYSSRYPEVTPFEEEARTIFSESYAGTDGQEFVVPFEGRNTPE